MRNYTSIGVQVPDLLVPDATIDHTKWSVIACDQFTSRVKYWDEVKCIVNDSPSTLHLILPEVYLGKPEEKKIVDESHHFMREYVANRTLKTIEGMVFVERTTSIGKRYGLILALDLEQYDYREGSKSLIRATEGTILERLPPRIRIRENAPLEIPHIMVLIDDPEKSVIEPIKELISFLPKLYDFDLMLGSGHLKGFLLNDLSLEKQIISALESLASPEISTNKYESIQPNEPMLFAVGDGNHSLATAKSVWDMKKVQLGMDHPLRYALVEIENIHDEGLVFGSIHRVLFNIDQDMIEALNFYFKDSIEICLCESLSEVIESVKQNKGRSQKIGLVKGGYQAILSINKPKSNLAVGSLKGFLDNFLDHNDSIYIDYIHDTDAFLEMSQQINNFGFFLPPMAKKDLFQTVILDGALPCKTFSMGEAKDKRFYLECRKIQDIT